MVENKAAFLNGYYNVTCTCAAVVKGSSNPTITTGNYTTSVGSGHLNNSFELSRLNIGTDFIAPFAAASLNGDQITIDFYHRNVVPGSSIVTGTVSPAKNSFTISSTIYQFEPPLAYHCKNIYKKQLITK